MLLHVYKGDVASAGFGLHRYDMLLIVCAGLEFHCVLIAGRVRKILAIAAFATAGELVAVVLIAPVQRNIASLALQQLAVLLLQVFAIPVEHLLGCIVAVVVKRDYL